MTKEQDPPPAYAPLKPLHGNTVAVAIEGKKDGSDSPSKIIASGRGKLAEQILALAFSKGVKVREDADLAELLVKLDLDTPIPTEAILAVAEILARVYEANGRADPHSPHELT
jgi:flagellar biosynthesis protein